MQNSGEDSFFDYNPYRLDQASASQYVADPENAHKPYLPEIVKHTIGIVRETAVDYKESENKLIFLGKSALGVIAQGAEIWQVPVIFIPTLTLDSLKSTHSPLTAGAVAGGLTFLWHNAVGETLLQGLHSVPKSVKKYKDMFPQPTLAIYDKPIVEQELAKKDKNTAYKLIGATKKMGELAACHTVNGLNATFRGMTSYVTGSTVTSDRNKKDIRKFYQKASVDGAFVAALLTASITELVAHIGTSNPELANRMQYYEGDKWVGYGILSLVAGVTLAKKYHRRNNQKIKEMPVKYIKPPEH